MSSQKHHGFMRNLDRCYDEVLQKTAKGGITAAEISKNTGMHKTMVHHLLNTLEVLKKVENQNGIWRVKAQEQTTKPLEKEIVIELPIPKDQWQRMTILEALAKDWEGTFPDTGNLYRISLEKLKETRTIKITGKNVDDLDLEKTGNLIQEAHKKSSLFMFKGLFKNLRKPRQQSPKSSET